MHSISHVLSFNYLDNPPPRLIKRFLYYFKNGIIDGVYVSAIIYDLVLTTAVKSCLYVYTLFR